MSEDLIVAGRFIIPGRELSWRFAPTGGPGGQHANKVSSRAELSYDLAASTVFDDETKQRVITRLGGRLHHGVVTVIVDESRSQWRNRQLARRRLAALLDEAMRPARIRRRTKPSKASQRRRLEWKRRHGATKRLRRPPEAE